MSDKDDVIIKPIADFGILVEFGTKIDDAVHDRVLEFDAALRNANLPNVTEVTPSYASVMVEYDPLETDFSALKPTLLGLLPSGSNSNKIGQTWQIPVCYDGAYAPDLEELSRKLDMPQDDIIHHHLTGSYKIYMYGFAPGYAYMGGVPEVIQFPRKEKPAMNVPKASVMIAGPQCLITTMKMPSGWWVIGQAAKTPLDTSADRPFLFDVGDKVEFIRVDETEFKKLSAKEKERLG